MPFSPFVMVPARTEGDCFVLEDRESEKNDANKNHGSKLSNPNCNALGTYRIFIKAMFLGQNS